jgi:NADH-quinone oxidoreductase subunit E
MATMNSSLDQNTASPETPGTKHFTPFEPTPDFTAAADKAIAAFPPEHKQAAVLPLIHEIQHRHGFISAKAIEWIAEKLEIQPVRVLEVVSFYPGIRQSAPGKFHIRVCRTLSCAMAGSAELMEKLCELTKIDRSGCDSHHNPVAVSPCGNFSVEFVECLASCGTGPVCMVNDEFHEAVTADKAAGLVETYKKSSKK